MNNTAGLLAALGFVALGLTSTSADAHVDVAVAPFGVAVAAPGVVVTLGTPAPVYAPAPVVYAPPPPTTVVYHRPSYRAPVRYYPSRPVVTYDRGPSCSTPRGHGHAYGHAHRGPPPHARGKGHGAKHRR